MGDVITELVTLTRKAVENLTDLANVTGRLPFDAAKIKPLPPPPPFEYNAPIYRHYVGPDLALLREIIDDAKYGAPPLFDPWLLSDFSYGRPLRPTMVPWKESRDNVYMPFDVLRPEFLAMIEEMYPKQPEPPGPIRKKLETRYDNSALAALRRGMGFDATRSMTRSWNHAKIEWDPADDRLARFREIGLGTVQALSRGFDGFFDNLISGTLRGAEAFKRMAAGILQDIAKITAHNLIAEPLAMGIGRALGLGPPVAKSHAGSLVGTSGTSSTLVNPFLFLGAPRLHHGLAPDEFPAILQRGERVVPKSQAGAWDRGGGAININVSVDGSRGGTPAQNKAFGAEVARQIEAMVDARIARAAMPRGILRPSASYA